MKEIKLNKLKNKGVCAPEGFWAAGVAAGIKKKNKKDLALIFSVVPARVAAVFTTNTVKAAPVLISMRHAQNGEAQAIVANSGCANCCTGQEGLQNAMSVVAAVGTELGVRPEMVLPCWTGLIGPHLPAQTILKNVPKLVASLSPSGGESAAQAIMTTDTFKKEVAVTYIEGTSRVTIGGTAKGAGMICPNMATMLCFITTDCMISSTMLQKALSSAVKTSFNRINIDGDMSTNDTALLLANGMAENDEIKSERSPAYARFLAALTQVCDDLSIMIVKDGEGATKTLAIEVKGAPNAKLAENAARKISNSNLFKCALFASNPNWGRIMAAIGGVDTRINPRELTLMLCGIKVFEKGEPCPYNAKVLQKKFSQKDTTLCVDLHAGKHAYTVLTCDLTYDYVDINL